MLFHVISDTLYTQNVTLPNKGISHPKTAAPWYMTSLLLFGFYDLKALVGIGSMCYFRKGVCCSSSNSRDSIRCLYIFTYVYKIIYKGTVRRHQ